MRIEQCLIWINAIYPLLHSQSSSGSVSKSNWPEFRRKQVQILAGSLFFFFLFSVMTTLSCWCQIIPGAFTAMSDWEILLCCCDCACCKMKGWVYPSTMEIRCQLSIIKTVLSPDSQVHKNAFPFRVIADGFFKLQKHKQPVKWLHYSLLWYNSLLKLLHSLKFSPILSCTASFSSFHESSTKVCDKIPWVFEDNYWMKLWPCND